MIKKAKEKEYAGDAGAGCACRYGYTKPDDYPSCMYDEETGLPSFNLFEDRLKMALINERVKDLRMRKLKIAVVAELYGCPRHQLSVLDYDALSVDQGRRGSLGR